MNVLVLNWLDRENPAAGGAEVHLHESFGRLAAGGWRVTLVTSGWPGGAPRAELDGMEIRRVGGRYSFAARARPHVLQRLSDRRFDVAVEDLNKVPLFLPRWSPAPSVLLVHHLFGSTVFQEAALPLALATWLLERPIPRVYREVPVVAVSGSTKEDLVRRGLKEDRIQVVQNGVDADRLQPIPREARYPEPTLLYLGRLKRYKRVDLAIEAVARLRRQGESVRLVIAGKGDYRSVLERRARRLGLGPNEVEFRGFVSEAEKAELLQRTWVHVLTSPKEGWGITNLEAAACGTPTVASDSPGLRDSVLHERTGFLVPHGDVDALAERLRLLIADEPLRRRMGEAGRRFAESLSWERTAERLGKALEAAVASP